MLATPVEESWQMAMAAWRTVATSEGGGRPCGQVSPFEPWLFFAFTQHKQLSYTVYIHAALGGGRPRWQPLNVAVTTSEWRDAGGELPGRRQWRRRHTVATGWWRHFIFGWGGQQQHGSGGFFTVLDSKFCYSNLYYSYSAFNIFNIRPFNRLFHSDRPVKIWPFLFKILCSCFSLNCSFKNDICMSVLYFINTHPPPPSSCWAWKAGSLFNNWRCNLSLLHTCCLSSSTLQWGGRGLVVICRGGGGELWGYISSYEQLILNYLSPVTVWAKESSYLTHTWSYIHMTNLMTYSFFPSYLGGGVGKILRQLCFPPIFHAGWGWGCDWLGPPLSLVLANVRVGTGGKGQPLRMTNLTYLTS